MSRGEHRETRGSGGAPGRLVAWPLLLSALLSAPAAARADFTLEDCLAAARREHPRLAAARAETAAAQAREAIARAGLLPTLSADGSYLATRGTGSLGTTRFAAQGATETTLLGPAELELWSAGVGLRQTIWDFGRTTNAMAAAEAGREAAAADERLWRDRLAVEAEVAFRTAAAADRLVAAYEEAALRAAAHLERARARAEVGLRPRYDVTRAEVEVASAELARVAADNARALAWTQLATACGLPSLPSRTLAPPPPRLEQPEPDETTLEGALERLPELRAAQARVEAAEQATDAARSLYFPNLGAVGSVAYRGLAVDELAPGWSAQVQLAVPILAGGGDLGRVREAEARLAAARAALETARRAGRLEQRAAVLAVREARARLGASRGLARAAEEGLRLAEGRYETGLGDALELADAQAALSSAQAGLVRAELDAAVAEARLERVRADAAAQASGESR